MKFSVTLPRPGDGASGPGFQGYVALAQAVERLGLHAVSASDHPFPLVADGEAGHQAHDPFVLLSYVAAATMRIALHFSLVIAPYRNPFLVARGLGSLDYASGGRVIAGLGAGYLRAEFDALGADFSRRADTVSEAVTALRAAWSGKPVSQSGTGWRAQGNVMLPAPVSSPHPPLWRGGNSRRAIADAVRFCDGWTPFEVNYAGSRQTATDAMSLETIPARMKVLRDSMEAAGRVDPMDVCYVRTSRRWLRSADLVSEHLAALASCGVTWLEFNVAGRGPAEWIECVETFAATAHRDGFL
jgi:probable F420-dependent oxidoreductase